MLSNFHVEHNVCTFDLIDDISLANAIRRAMLSDIETVAPSKVEFEVNTSCQTDEYIAHRIGMIPFVLKLDDNDSLEEKSLSFDVRDRPMSTRDLQGDTNISTIYTTDIMKLISGQQIKGRVFFEKGSGKDHARFSPVAAVAYTQKKDKILFRFESINGEDPKTHLLKALKKMQSRLENVRFQLENGQNYF
jgi:DNA-directed RNA polymerase alpha subunit